MAKKQAKRKSLASTPALQGVTLREENVGRKHANPHEMLRLQHLQRLAIWAGGEAAIPPLAAHFGRLLAANAEREGIPLDPSIVSCQRCETILRPGYNCTIRIKKNPSGTRRHRKSDIQKNNVVYTCHFCSHGNMRRGASKGHMKDLLASRPMPKSSLADSISTTVRKSDKDATVANDLNEHVRGSCLSCGRIGSEKAAAREILAKDSPKTPSNKASEKKTKITGFGSSKSENTGSSFSATGSGKDSSVSGKRKRRGWSGLREITLSNEHEKKLQMNNLAIPFLM